MRSWPARARARIDWIAVGGLALLALFLQPGLHAAFRGDDTWTSTERGKLALTGDSLVSHLWQSAEHFVKDSGRPTPFGPIQGLFTSWALDGHALLYHAFLLALTLAAGFGLYALVREFGFSRPAGLLVMIVLAGAIQFRSYHDAALGYWGTTQIVIILTEASLLVFLRGLRRGDKRLMVISFLLFLPCPLLYEIAYPLVALHLGVALVERRGVAAIRASLPFLLLGFAFVVLSIVARSSAPSIVPGYQIGGGPWATLRTWVVQLFTPLPASNVFFHADYGAFFPLGSHPTKAELLGAGWRGAAVFGLVLVLTLRMTGRDGSRLPQPRALWAAGVTGALLWTTSVITMSAAPKYQSELVAGKGHLPALAQSLGWALLATAALLAVMRAATRRSFAAVRLTAVAAAGLLGFAAGVVGFNNIRVIALETPVVQTRALLERAAEHGAFAGAAPDATLIFSRADLLWPTGNWTQVPEAFEEDLLERTGHRYDARIAPPPDRFTCAATRSEPPSECEPPRSSSAWVRVRAWPGGGSVFLGAVPAAARANTFGATTRNLRVFVRSDNGVPGPERLVGRTGRGQPWSSDRVAWRRLTAGDDWAVYAGRIDGGAPPVASTLDDGNGRLDFTNLGTPDQIVRIFGTKRLLP